MYKKPTFNALLLCGVLFFILVSCKNKDINSQEISEKKAKDKRMETISMLYNDGKYSEFIKQTEAELKNTESPDFYLPLSSAYGHLNNFEKAFYYARKELNINPFDYYALLTIGDLHFLTGKLDSAEIYYNKVQEIRPTYARVYLNLAQLYTKQNNTDKAVNQYLKAILLFKQNN